MSFTFPGNCADHKYCDCDLHVSGVPPIQDFVVLRYKESVKRTLNMMYAEMTANLSQHYSIEGNCVVRNMVPNIVAYLDNLSRASAVFDSDIIRPQFVYSNQSKPIPRVDASFLQNATGMLDKWYFGNLGFNFDNYVWAGSTSELRDNRVYSLVELCAKTLSYSHYACGRRYGHVSWCNTMELWS
jgi:hypothetical protein